jgi:hypothetical protein
MGKLALKILSFLLSLALYATLLFFLLYVFLKSESFKRIEIEGEPIEVVIAEPQQKKVAKPMKKIRKSEEKPKPKPKGSPSPKQGSADLKSLFASINAKRVTQKKTTTARPKTKPSRKRGKSAKKLFESLDLQTLELSSNKKSIKSVSGEKDPYMQKVYKILYENWVPSKLSAGASAKVRFSIDTQGYIEYEVLEWSQNETFNEELKNYLAYLKSLQFPKPSKRREFVVRFEAKE